MHVKKYLLAALIAGLIISTAARAQAPHTTQNYSNPELTPAQQLAIKKLIGEYLHENPEVMIKAIQAYQQRRQAREQQRQRANVAKLKNELENDPTSPTAGNPESNVTVVEFFDYQCHFCKQVFPSIRTLLKETKDVRYIFKELPILSLGSQIAARSALVVWKYNKEKYFDFHSDLMESHGTLTEHKVLHMAAKHGLDTSRIKREMNSEYISKILKRNFDLARQLGIQGTPGFVVGSTLVPGAVDLRTLRRMIADARTRP